MNLLRKAFFAAAVLFGATSAVRADILIDDFSAPAAGISYSINGSNPNPSVFVTPLNANSGRSVTLTVTTPTLSSDSLSGDIGGASGWFSMALNASSAGNAVISYSFTNPVNFSNPTGNLGAINYNAFADAGLGSSVPLNFVITTSSGSYSFNTQFNLSASLTDVQSIPLSSFTTAGNLTSVTGLSITILGNQATDVILDNITITEPPSDNPVPAPPAALLALLALPALRFRNRWNRKEPALA